MKHHFLHRLFVMLLIALLCLTACGEIKPIEPTEEEARVVMRADQYDICYDELRYYACNLKDQMAAYYGSDIWASAETAAPYVEELKEGVEATIDELREYAVAHMARHKVPRYIEFVSEFPMNAAGKIQKFKMREAAIERLGLKKK